MRASLSVCAVTGLLLAWWAAATVAAPTILQIEGSAGPSFSTPQNAPTHAPNSVLVRFKSGPTAAAVAAAQARVPVVPGLQLVSLNGEYQHVRVPSGPAAAAAFQVPPSAVMKFQITDGESVAAKVAQLQAHPAVDHAQPELIYYATAPRMPNDPSYKPGEYTSGQWYLPQVWAPTAWATTVGSRAIRVCVIDSGAWATHQDLKSNIVGGWNRAVYGEKTSSPYQPAPGSALYKNFTDTNGHGTHCAGTVGATGNNGVGVTGMNWKVSLYICKAGNDGGFYESAVLDCYHLCRQARVHVVSNSYGGRVFSKFKYDAIAKLRDAGALFVAAAGNEYVSSDDAPRYPASYKLDNIISVAATDADDTLSPFSNWGKNSTHLAAPGSMILNTWAGSNTAYTTISGTSMACPLVAGSAALIWSARPTATYAQVKAALMSGVDKVPALNNRVISGGRLNVAKALAKLLGRPEPPAPAKPASYWVTDACAQYIGEYRQVAVATTATTTQCLQLCQSIPWCFVARACESGYVFKISGSAGQETQTGNCVMHDKAFKMGAIVRSSACFATSAYKRIGPPPTPQPPTPGPFPPLPAPRGSWAAPITIPSTPFLTGWYKDFVEDYSPVACHLERNRVRVFRWFSGSAKAGWATASSCGYTVSNPSVSVVSSPYANKGPYTCLGGQNNADAKCGNAESGSDAFVFSFRYEPNRYYFLAVSPHDMSRDKLPEFRLNFTVSPGGSAPGFAPSTSLGSWAKPVEIPGGAGGLPYLSGYLFQSAFKFTNPQPVKCAWEGRDNAHVFRWYSASVQGVMLTAHSCNFTFNYPLLNIFKSASQTGNASTLACMISSLSYENEGAHSDRPFCKPTFYDDPFIAHVHVEPRTYYWFAVAPTFTQYTTFARLGLGITCRAPAKGTWSSPTVISSLPFTSQPFCGYHRGTPPKACNYGRKLANVFRWFSGSKSGTLTASSCNKTVGDPVISVLASQTTLTGFSCVGGNDDDLACPSNNGWVGAFGTTIQFRPNTYYWFAVSPTTETTYSQVTLKITATVVSGG